MVSRIIHRTKETPNPVFFEDEIYAAGCKARSRSKDVRGLGWAPLWSTDPDSEEVVSMTTYQVLTADKVPGRPKSSRADPSNAFLFALALLQAVGAPTSEESHGLAVGGESVREFRRAMAYYERHRKNILSKHEGKYVAIWKDQVIDSDLEFSALAERVYGKLGYRAVYMPFVSPGTRELRAPAPRVVRLEK